MKMFAWLRKAAVPFQTNVPEDAAHDKSDEACLGKVAVPFGADVPEDAAHDESDDGGKEQAGAVVGGVAPVRDLQLPLNPPELGQG